jgi:hypothetical protein
VLEHVREDDRVESAIAKRERICEAARDVDMQITVERLGPVSTRYSRGVRAVHPVKGDFLTPEVGEMAACKARKITFVFLGDE